VRSCGWQTSPAWRRSRRYPRFLRQKPLSPFAFCGTHRAAASLTPTGPRRSHGGLRRLAAGTVNDIPPPFRGQAADSRGFSGKAPHDPFLPPTGQFRVTAGAPDGQGRPFALSGTLPKSTYAANVALTDGNSTSSNGVRFAKIGPMVSRTASFAVTPTRTDIAQDADAEGHNASATSISGRRAALGEASRIKLNPQRRPNVQSPRRSPNHSQLWPWNRASWSRRLGWIIFAIRV
jgi:hypothetical protein